MAVKFVRAGVIGYPVKHSRSPVIHNYWIKRAGLKGSYDVIEIPPEGLKEGIDKLMHDGYAGFNVTIPHKESVMQYCHIIDNRANAIGAVNTVSFDRKKLCGFNTDVFGFLQNIHDYRPEFDYETDPAVVLGSGGASRAIVYALLEKNAPEIRLLNRTRNRAEGLKKMAPEKIKVLDWEDRSEALSRAGILINTTSLGMHGQPPLDIDLKKLPVQALVCDIVYTPLKTPLLLAAERRGNPVVTGIGMLLHQARPAFQAWFGILPDIDDQLRKLVLQ